MKMLFAAALAAALLVSCAGEPAPVQKPATKPAVKAPVAEFTVAGILAAAEEHAGKTVRITGTVEHVCKHGGKRMFLMGENPEDRFKITAVKTGPFDRELEGSTVQVEGVIEVLKIDAAYLDEMEAKSKHVEEGGREGHGEAEGEHSDDEHHAEAEAQEGQLMTCEQVDDLRKRLEEEGKDSLSFFSMACSSFKKVE